MASGILGQSVPAASTYTTVYTVPVSKLAILNVNILNRSTSVVSVRLSISATDTPANSEFIEYGASIPANGIMERTAFVVDAGKKIVVYTSSADCSVSVYGYEE